MVGGDVWPEGWSGQCADPVLQLPAVSALQPAGGGGQVRGGQRLLHPGVPGPDVRRLGADTLSASPARHPGVS